MAKIPLIHPIYLDVPMLVSFAAAVRGGVTMETEVTEHEGSSRSTGGKVSGRLGFSKLFLSLFDASMDSALESKREADVASSRKESKAHTEASIAILLYNELRESDGYILFPKTIDDVTTYGAGSLVEVGGTVEKNAVDQMIDYIDAMTILGGVASSTSASHIPGGKKSRSAANNESNPLGQLAQMRKALDSDRKRTPISNIVVRCTEPSGLNVVATLRTENLRDLTLSELDKNSVRVIGKITRVLPEGQSMSSFENYGMGLLSPALLNEAFQGIKQNKEVVTPLSEIEVSGPAWQILPLMIFV